MANKQMNKILIANRGEIAVRIIRACKELDIKTVAVYSEADKDMLHTKMADEAICVGASPASKSYLNTFNILSAYEITGADAIHPGVGFLSEDYRFAQLCEDLNITYIGPKSSVIRQMGDKSKARKLMKDSGIPIIEGSEGYIVNVEDALIWANKIGYPVLIKASFGGGGKGIRIANNDEELRKQFNISKLESKRCFGRDELYFEKYIKNAKHIEFQIAADKYGNIIYLGERDCSMQRNKQKVIEESPSTILSSELREEIGQVAIKAARIARYENVGTVEFLIDRDNNYYFIEMNTRIQVEHPITEEVTGIDLIKEQIKIARREKLSLAQEDVKIQGHSIECRINSENPRNNFIPSSGKINKVILPGGKGVRVDMGICEGMEVSQYYDSMIAKLIVHGINREEAIRKMIRALDEIKIEGISTNIEFERWVLNQKEFLDGSYNTEFLADKVVNSNEF